MTEETQKLIDKITLRIADTITGRTLEMPGVSVAHIRISGIVAAELAPLGDLLETVELMRNALVAIYDSTGTNAGEQLKQCKTIAYAALPSTDTLAKLREKQG